MFSQNSRCFVGIPKLHTPGHSPTNKVHRKSILQFRKNNHSPRKRQQPPAYANRRRLFSQQERVTTKYISRHERGTRSHPFITEGK